MQSLPLARNLPAHLRARVPFEKRSDLDPATVPQDGAALSQLSRGIGSLGLYAHISADNVFALRQRAISDVVDAHDSPFGL